VRQSQTGPEYFDEGALIGVLTAEPLDRMLDYKAPEGGCHLGAFIEVPLGPRKVIGTSKKCAPLTVCLMPRLCGWKCAIFYADRQITP
jgi:hypothetical protein